MKNYNFAKGVEKLVNPMDVGAIHFIQPFNKLLPKFIQDKLIKSSAQKTPYMGFVVEPFSTYLCYEILDLEKAKELLPDGFELVKTKVFAEDEPKYCCIFGCFTAHTSAFWGTRIEFYVIAEDKSTGLLSWIIIDYDSNTISYDKKHGLKSPNSKAVLTTDNSKNIILDVERLDGFRKISFVSNFENSKSELLDKRLWVEGNLSIGYGRDLGQGKANIFSLRFDPKEIEYALNVPINDINLISNTWFEEVIAKVPYRAVCFPHSLHFLSDSPGHASNLKNEAELVKTIENFSFEGIKTMSADSFKSMFMISSLVSVLIALTLFILLILE